MVEIPISKLFQNSYLFCYVKDITTNNDDIRVDLRTMSSLNNRNHTIELADKNSLRIGKSCLQFNFMIPTCTHVYSNGQHRN